MKNIIIAILGYVHLCHVRKQLSLWKEHRSRQKSSSTTNMHSESGRFLDLLEPQVSFSVRWS